MVDLSTTYMGIPLEHPIVPGAGPLVDDLDRAKRYEDAGAAALCMRSLFEEQIVADELAFTRAIENHSDAYAEATSYFSELDAWKVGPDEYLEHLMLLKDAVNVPVFGSLNGTTKGRWLDYARGIEEAGASGLELNLYTVAADPSVSAETLENELVDVVREVCASVKIPVAVKLSPFYTALAHFAQRATDAGAKGLILFNRFYQPDIDPYALEVSRTLHLSDSTELLLRLRWLAILSGRMKASLACSGGIHESMDALKAIMAGADVVQMVSALLRKGPHQLTTVLARLRQWLDEHEYTSLDQARGSMNLDRSPDPQAYERSNYIHILQAWS